LTPSCWRKNGAGEAALTLGAVQRGYCFAVWQIWVLEIWVLEIWVLEIWILAL
jgi:hypothetical protein